MGASKNKQDPHELSPAFLPEFGLSVSWAMCRNSGLPDILACRTSARRSRTRKRYRTIVTALKRLLSGSGASVAGCRSNSSPTRRSARWRSIFSGLTIRCPKAYRCTIGSRHLLVIHPDPKALIRNSRGTICNHWDRDPFDPDKVALEDATTLIPKRLEEVLPETLMV